MLKKRIAYYVLYNFIYMCYKYESFGENGFGEIV